MGLLYLTPLKGVSTPSWNPGLESPVIWYRMDTVTGSGSSLTFIDKGPNGYDATVVASSGPSIVPSVINGQPVARFVAASNQSMTMAGTTALLNKNSSNTIVIVSKASGMLGSGSFSTLLSAATDASLYTSVVLSNFSGYGELFQGGGTANVDSSVGLSSFDYFSNFFALTSSYSGAGSFSTAANYSWLTNNTSNNPIDFPTGAVNTGTPSNTVGSFGPSGLYFDGDIAEIIIFPTALSGGILTNLHVYLNTRYGVGVG